jgi:serine/threonine-protein kinase
VVTTGSFAGMTQDRSVTVAVSISATELRAYLCDGKAIEAWFRGPVGANGFSLTNASAASLTGQIAADVVSMHFEVAGRVIDLTATRSTEPAGLYEAWIRENGREIHIGWAVPPDGPPVGLVTEKGNVLQSAPPLNTDDLSYEWQRTRKAATRV